MIKLPAFAFIAACACLAGCASTSNGPALVSSDDGRFVIVLHEGADPAIAGPMLKLLTENAARIKADLGVTDTTTYTVHVRASEREYLQVMQNLIGESYPGSTGYISGRYRAELLANPGVVQDALHEYAHSLSLYIQPGWYNRPRWLWEALATYEAGEFFDPKNLVNIRLGIFPSIAELNKDYKHSGHQIYQAGYLLFEFLKERWGMETVKELIRRRGDIPSVLGISVEDFERGWDDFVTRKYL